MTHTNVAELNLIISEYLREELLLKGHNWQNLNQVNNEDLILNSNKRKKVVYCLCTLSQLMRTNFSEQLNQMCEKLDNEVADLVYLDYDSFKNVADELFSQGVKWGHLVCLLVFGSELILSTIDENPSRELIDNICQYLSIYIKDNLLNWINDHQAWDGLIDYTNLHTSTEIDGCFFKKFTWSDKRFLKLGALISVGLVGLVCVLIAKNRSNI